MPGYELLTTEEMAEADRRAVALGIPSLTLMETAGRAVADEAAKMVPAAAKIAVLCGPGNNGGDGFVAARLLAERGYEVRVACLVPIASLKGDAAVMAGKWSGPVEPLAPSVLTGSNLIIDAIFGAGLSRPLDGAASDAVAAVNASGISILAVDVPSGLDANSGAALVSAVKATRTITFFRRKPGQVLLPGRTLCGEVIVSNIGIPDEVLDSPLSPSVPSMRSHGFAMTPERGEGWGEGRPLAPESVAAPHPNPLPVSTGRGDDISAIASFENAPALWFAHFPWPKLDGHKYQRGHAVVVSGPALSSGAARLGARGALRIGAGLVTLVGNSAASTINAAHTNAVMVRRVEGENGLRAFLEDKRRNAVLIGPGASVGEETASDVLTVLASNAAVVLDADAMTSFAIDSGSATAESGGFGFLRAGSSGARAPQELFNAIKARTAPVILTPHEGEFNRLFGDAGPIGSSKLDRARAAAKDSGAVIVLKGADTVIARPDGFAAINTNAPPSLATAGSGDVLAGFITGLLAQGMPAFEAACAGVWLHSECANVFGIGLIAEDLPEVLPKVLQTVRE